MVTFFFWEVKAPANKDPVVAGDPYQLPTFFHFYKFTGDIKKFFKNIINFESVANAAKKG